MQDNPLPDRSNSSFTFRPSLILTKHFVFSPLMWINPIFSVLFSRSTSGCVCIHTLLRPRPHFCFLAHTDWALLAPLFTRLSLFDVFFLPFNLTSTSCCCTCIIGNGSLFSARYPACSGISTASRFTVIVKDRMQYLFPPTTSPSMVSSIMRLIGSTRIRHRHSSSVCLPASRYFGNISLYHLHTDPAT
ncbi:hypothetical protein P280DRAFT_128316 [Massarina eburnea CBS 473.64]|uniref:Uncharacterized protein n=1 Tax=Massarina eburnea CBS 473.64 TaxID=1395130 RepID=A0A6A6SD76_9PLEO|nr:hypothetical protein P280DRAFT_128316 [Massarina eburnea CBS 473.64]